MPKRHVTRFSLGAFLLLLLSAFIVGCGSSTASTPPKATATAPAPTPVPTVMLTTYKGTGYAIGYPQGWTLQGSGQQVQILDATQDQLLIQTATGSSGSSSSNTHLMETVLQGLLNIMKQGSKDFKEIGGTQKTTVGGAAWDQRIFTMTDPKLGPIQFNILYTQNPKNTGQIITMLYGTTTKTFDKVNTDNFQPMLQSFQFQA
ncbi:MAG: hypothetical protein H0V70_26020 [Ktedonobacteraceae bacterium]|nr:hypothetical protein [Ktedonobacteraceae bacterium]